MARNSTKLVYAAIGSNLAVAISKFAVALLSGSAAMLAEGFHSAADTGNEILLLIGLKRSSRPADQQHPFGHGRELYFWAFVVAMSIFILGGGLSIYEGIGRLLHPRALEDPTWNYVVLGAAAIFEGYSWSVSRKELNRRRRRGESLISAVHRSKDPSVFTVVVEDSAALAGLSIAFLGVFVSHRLGLPQIDAAASVFIGIVLVLAAVALAVETGGLLVGESADRHILDNLSQIIASETAVESVGNVLTMQLGPEEVLLVADVSFKPQLGTHELEKAVDRIEERVQRRHPSVKRIYFEAETLSRRSSAKDRAA